ncbi:hypothetical protein WAI453_005375 [Rhynchosporium graminicola]
MVYMSLYRLAYPPVWEWILLSSHPLETKRSQSIAATAYPLPSDISYDIEQSNRPNCRFKHLFYAITVTHALITIICN